MHHLIAREARRRRSHVLGKNRALKAKAPDPATEGFCHFLSDSKRNDPINQPVVSEDKGLFGDHGQLGQQPGIQSALQRVNMRIASLTQCSRQTGA